MSDANGDIISKSNQFNHRPEIEENERNNESTAVGARQPAKSEQKEEQNGENVFQVKIILPHQPYEILCVVSTQDQIQDLRQSIMESPGAFQYSCFHLEFQDRRINDFVELSEIEGLVAGSELRLIEDPYTEKEARSHLIRIREIIGASGNTIDTLYGISAGLSLHDSLSSLSDAGDSKGANPLARYSVEVSPAIWKLLPPSKETPLRTVKSISLSSWNPPPPQLRQQGHLLYIQLTTNEGEQYQITSHITGFYVNRSSNSKFDPYPRSTPKRAAAHSLLSLIRNLSPSFKDSFDTLLASNSKRDPLSNFQIANAIPSSPWLIHPSVASPSAHLPDLARSQEPYLFSGVDNTETLRDWNEEIQTARELPRNTIQDRVFRERLLLRTFAEFNDAAARGAVLIARGEVAPLNPTEARDAQIFVFNNVFYSFGADGVNTFTSEGGDEAARVAVGKDVAGVRAVNQLDISGLAGPGTIVVDYLGKRLVAQSIVPGIFKQREPGEHQVDYGGVEGRDVVAESDAFVSTFSQVSAALKIKRHPVWDKEGKKHVLEASVETKGLLGTDSRKYILDLYRLTPLDIWWIENYWSDIPEGTEKPKTKNYPHRMVVLRPELIESYWRLKMSEYVKTEMEKREISSSVEQLPAGLTKSQPESEPEIKLKEKQSESDNSAQEKNMVKKHVDISAFSLAMNPDVFCGQHPQTEEDKKEWARDELEVRAASDFLHSRLLPEMVQDLENGEIGFPLDDDSLTRLMHRRGINIRYLGKLASLADKDSLRSQSLEALAVQAMIARAFKHIVNQHLKNVPAVFAAEIISHFLNCLLGVSLNDSPKAVIEESIEDLYRTADFSFKDVTPAIIKSKIESQVDLRYRYLLAQNWMDNIKHLQILRSISLKLGLQLVAKEYSFRAESLLSNGGSTALKNDHFEVNECSHTNGGGKRKKRNNGRTQSPAQNSADCPVRMTTFKADDILNIVPIVKDASPKSVLAEETLEAGKLSMMQNQKEVGQELLLESMTLHEQIYGILHPEVARVYHQLAMLYFQLDEKSAAVELAHKAVIISERTLGVDSSETLSSYLNLSLFEHGHHNTSIALSYIRHAMEILKIVYGTKHPDSVTTLNNAAVMLQNLQLYKESRQWFEVALSMSEEVSGKDSVNTATVLFQLAQALVLDQDHKGAVLRMREAYNIYLTKLGPKDSNTIESEKWLEQLTQNAVSMAKHAKDLQARRTRRLHFNPRTIHLGARAQPQVGQSVVGIVNGHHTSNQAFDARNVDELIRFIEGSADHSKTANIKKRANRGNPKSRGGASMGSA